MRRTNLWCWRLIGAARVGLLATMLLCFFAAPSAAGDAELQLGTVRVRLEPGEPGIRVMTFAGVVGETYRARVVRIEGAGDANLLLRDAAKIELGRSVRPGGASDQVTFTATSLGTSVVLSCAGAATLVELTLSEYSLLQGAQDLIQLGAAAINLMAYPTALYERFEIVDVRLAENGFVTRVRFYSRGRFLDGVLWFDLDVRVGWNEGITGYEPGAYSGLLPPFTTTRLAGSVLSEMNAATRGEAVTPTAP